MSSTNNSKVPVWLNAKTHTTIDIAFDTTCTHAAEMLGSILRIPSVVRPFFAIHTTIDGKDQGALGESETMIEVLHKNQKYFDKWGNSKDNGFIYLVNADTYAQMTTSINPTVLQPAQDHQLRKGIGHQRSKSSPAIASGMQRNVPDEKEASKVLQQVQETARTRNQIIDERYPLEKRSATPIPNRDTSTASQDEKDEAKGLGTGAAPHLEPRSGNVSPSPPRASLKARSKTIAFSAPVVPGLAIKPSSGNQSPLASPTLGRARGISPSPRGIQSWDEATPKGGSWGRSQGSVRTRRTSMNLFETEPNETLEQSTGSKGRRASPPPPRQRYTPPPTILSPMVGSILGNPLPPNTTSPLTRLRAQTAGSKPIPQKWVKVRATKPGLNTSTGAIREVGEMLLHTVATLEEYKSTEAEI